MNSLKLIRLFILNSFLLASIIATFAHAEEYTNFLGMKFVTIPAGSFEMGAAEEKSGVKFDELPQHKVDVSEFQIMTTEVTLAHYKRYIIESSNIKILRDGFMNANGHDDNAPVVFVSWNDARNFLHWLNKNKPKSDKGEYMLPSEAEWEYACRSRKNELFCGGNSPGSLAWYSSKTIAYQQPVAQKQPNAFGLYDMSGNVREWVKDCYHESYANAPSDGRAWTKDCRSNKKVLRGGSWNEGQNSARATDRLAARISSRSGTIGFRAVRKLR